MSFYSCVNSTLATFGFLTTAFLEIGMALCSRSILLNNNNKTTDISPYNCKSKDQYTTTTYIYKGTWFLFFAFLKNAAEAALKKAALPH